MNANAIERTVAQIFQLERAPSFLARTASKAPIAFTHFEEPIRIARAIRVRAPGSSFLVSRAVVCPVFLRIMDRWKL
jgi:hypothetical protein